MSKSNLDNACSRLDNKVFASKRRAMRRELVVLSSSSIDPSEHHDSFVEACRLGARVPLSLRREYREALQLESEELAEVVGFSCERTKQPLDRSYRHPRAKRGAL